MSTLLEGLEVTFTTESHEDICQSCLGCSKVAVWDWKSKCRCGGYPVCQEHRDRWEAGTPDTYFCTVCKSVATGWKFTPHRRK